MYNKGQVHPTTRSSINMYNKGQVHPTAKSSINVYNKGQVHPTTRSSINRCREAGGQGGREAGRLGGREAGRQGGREAGRQGGNIYTVIYNSSMQLTVPLFTKASLHSTGTGRQSGRSRTSYRPDRRWRHTGPDIWNRVHTALD